MTKRKRRGSTTRRPGPYHKHVKKHGEGILERTRFITFAQDAAFAALVAGRSFA